MHVVENPTTKSGAEITPEIADALAAEAERGYDLSKAKSRRVWPSRRMAAPGRTIGHDGDTADHPFRVACRESAGC
jgi:hypothetical protein